MSPYLRSDSPLAVRYIDLCYDPHNSESSALRLIHTLFPEWQRSEGAIELIRFTDGITNTLLKAQKRRPGYSQEQVDHEAVLLRAYGQGTDVLIDRESESGEIRAHSLLASQGLAPPLFARFANGLLYKFVPGNVCSPQDIPRPQIYRAVAEKLGQWHATLSIAVLSDLADLKDADADLSGHVTSNCTKSDMPIPNMWSITHSWIKALPAESDKQREQVRTIQSEFDFLKAKLARLPGPFGKDFVFAHCDLLLGNVIIEPSVVNGHSSNSKVHFIDYEYSTPAPAAFDIANHFAEWAGMNCDYNAIPTTSTRRDFVESYVKSYFKHSDRPSESLSPEVAVDQLCSLVDLYRGVPGFYWGVWALIQAQISHIDFDYASYAEERFGEYYAWKAELDGSRVAQRKDLPLRERRWTQDDD
ncbi:putative choline/ethanolamine kinase [Myriangium duriaei CBS 260.36]|uniref:ethanolamine kinase n=1 Tax=Myriangium duriaei CBS 260.36 TaxID=1168546 RepID=A0A9P4MFL8_9PEZI|nr:putative choline/ethanolamine kinase [Myriangium duriaei CBS 260.36]